MSHTTGLEVNCFFMLGIGLGASLTLRGGILELHLYRNTASHSQAGAVFARASFPVKDVAGN